MLCNPVSMQLHGVASVPYSVYIYELYRPLLSSQTPHPTSVRQALKTNQPQPRYHPCASYNKKNLLWWRHPTLNPTEKLCPGLVSHQTMFEETYQNPPTQFCWSTLIQASQPKKLFPKTSAYKFHSKFKEKHNRVFIFMFVLSIFQSGHNVI